MSYEVGLTAVYSGTIDDKRLKLKTKVCARPCPEGFAARVEGVKSGGKCWSVDESRVVMGQLGEKVEETTKA